MHKDGHLRRCNSCAVGPSRRCDQEGDGVPDAPLPPVQRLDCQRWHEREPRSGQDGPHKAEAGQS